LRLPSRHAFSLRFAIELRRRDILASLYFACFRPRFSARQAQYCAPRFSRFDAFLMRHFSSAAPAQPLFREMPPYTEAIVTPPPDAIYADELP